MIRFKLTFDKDAEQDWLNGLCAQCWAMTGFFAGLYTFTPCQPGEFIYQVDLLPGEGVRAWRSGEYMDFMEETGVEVVQRWFRWVYLRRRAADGPFQIYTDVDSQIQMYRRIRKMFLWVFALECCCSLGVIPGAVLNDGVLIRCAIALFAMLLIAIARVIWRCTCIIQELERQK